MTNAGHGCPGCDALLHRLDKLERGQAAAMEMAAERIEALEQRAGFFEKQLAELWLLVRRIADVVNGNETEEG